MKKTTFIIAAVLLTVFGFSQNRVNVQKEFRNMSCINTAPICETSNFSSKSFGPKENKLDAEIIGQTWYDLQSNTSMQSRMYLYPDGFIGGTFTYGANFPSFSDRGTGYNSYDGTNWGPYPVQRIENDRTGWPSYTPWGQTGELVIAHYSGASVDGLAINKRNVKGTGNWTSTDLYAPAGASGLLWPRSATGGTDHSILHTIALTTPVSNGGYIYQGQDGALLYSRSVDGGNTWEIENIILEEINSDFYKGFFADTYDIIADGNNVEILIGDDWTGLVLLKSNDNGNTWTKTIIWEHPYPLFDHNNPIVTDTFYNCDGSHCVAFDTTGKVHIAFGINRAICDGSTEYWFPGVDGIGYWNEDRPAFSNNLNALCPYSDCSYSELIEDYSLVGWTQDINNNGVIDIIWDDIALYYLGLSSMPQLVVDDQNSIFLVYSSVTETYESVMQNYRHLWARGSTNEGETWGDFVDLNEDLIYYFNECVFPSCSPTSDDNIHLIYQQDVEPGLAVRGDLDPYTENYIEYMSIPKADLINVSGLGNLTGTVTELNGGDPVSGATITVQGTSFSTISSYNGTYSIN